MDSFSVTPAKAGVQCLSSYANTFMSSSPAALGGGSIIAVTPMILAIITCTSMITFAQAAAGQVGTSDWKTYRNKKMGFAVKYPDTWHVSQASGTGPECVLLDGPSQGVKPIGPVQFWVQRQINPKGLSIGDWYSDQMKNVKAQLSKTDTVIGGRPAVRYEIVGTLGNNYAFFTSLNKTDIFEITMILPHSQAQLDETRQNIISTVKFIN
jgi:hypothetical protein